MAAAGVAAPARLTRKRSADKAAGSRLSKASEVVGAQGTQMHTIHEEDDHGVMRCTESLADSPVSACRRPPPAKKRRTTAATTSTTAGRLNDVARTATLAAVAAHGAAKRAALAEREADTARSMRMTVEERELLEEMVDVAVLNAAARGRAAAARNNGTSSSRTQTPFMPAGWPTAARYKVYDELSPLGKGAFGTVHAVRCTATGRDLAIKRVDNMMGHDARYSLEYALRELQLMRRACEAFPPDQCPVPALVDVLVPPRPTRFGSLYVATELMDTDLRRALRGRPRLPMACVRDLARQLVTCVARLHACGIVHRDIKGDNILLRRENDGTVRLVVADLGLARSVLPEALAAAAAARDSPPLSSAMTSALAPDSAAVVTPTPPTTAVAMAAAVASATWASASPTVSTLFGWALGGGRGGAGAAATNSDATAGGVGGCGGGCGGGSHSPTTSTASVGPIARAAILGSSGGRSLAAGDDSNVRDSMRARVVNAAQVRLPPPSVSSGCSTGTAHGASHGSACGGGMGRGSGSAGLAPGTVVDPKDRFPKQSVYVVTRWYRPPELCVRDPQRTGVYSGTAVDMWSVGCVLAELLHATGETMLPGGSTRDQLRLMRQALGAPDAETVQAFRALTWAVPALVDELVSGPPCGADAPAVSTAYGVSRQSGVLNDRSIPEEARDLLRGLLAYDPHKRLTAAQALAHPFLNPSTAAGGCKYAAQARAAEETVPSLELLSESWQKDTCRAVPVSHTVADVRTLLYNEICACHARAPLAAR